MSSWGWKRDASVGLGRNTPGWLRPFAAVAPWATVALLLVMLHFASGSLASAEGVLFDLPAQGAGDADAASSIALVMPHGRDTLVFFDDSRYTIGDGASMAAFGEHLAARAAHASGASLLVMADRRASWGDLATLTSLARQNGMKRILFATKRTGGRAE